MINCVDTNFLCIHIDTQYSKLYYYFTRILDYIKLRKINASDWRKAAASVSQYTQAATIVESDVPLVANTIKTTAAHAQGTPQEDSYQEIIPAILQGHYTQFIISYLRTSSPSY